MATLYDFRHQHSLAMSMRNDPPVGLDTDDASKSPLITNAPALPPTLVSYNNCSREKNISQKCILLLHPRFKRSWRSRPKKATTQTHQDLTPMCGRSVIEFGMQARVMFVIYEAERLSDIVMT